MKNNTFIEKAKIVHGGKYDYSKVEYVNNHTKVCIICPVHGEFWQTPANHLSGQNCPKCSHRSYKKSTEEFIEEAKKVHGEKYDYSKVNYFDNTTKVCIICPIHGEFWQSPVAHLNGKGCQKCYDKKRGNTLRKTTEDFIKELKSIFGDKYDYSKVVYKNNDTKVCLICPEHGEFWQKPCHLLQRKKGCPACSLKERALRQVLSTKEFIDKAIKVHGDYYDYSLVDYKNAKSEVKIICPKHGVFSQKPNYHLSGNGCPKCKMSKLEFNILTELKKLDVKYEFNSHPKFLNGLELDFYLPELNLAIECQGRQHYEEVNFFGGKKGFEDTCKRDNIKKTLCEQNGIKLLYYTKQNVIGEKTYTDKEKIIKEIKQQINERNST